jgi:hypothetical protein
MAIIEGRRMKPPLPGAGRNLAFAPTSRIPSHPVGMEDDWDFSIPLVADSG